MCQLYRIVLILFQQQEIFRLSPDQLYTKKATCLQNIKPNCVELNFATQHNLYINWCRFSSIYSKERPPLCHVMRNVNVVNSLLSIVTECKIFLTSPKEKCCFHLNIRLKLGFLWKLGYRRIKTTPRKIKICKPQNQ